MTPPLPPPPDLALLLAPLSPESPTGEWLRFDPVYDRLRELRTQDDPTLPQGVWKRELKRADWPAVAALCAEVLTRRSKDLQVAIWLLEAWIHLDGFPGLERGLRLLAGLCRDFWDGLHPAADEEGVEARLSLFAWLADKLQLAVKEIPVTASATQDAVTYDWLDWESGLYLDNLARLDAAAAAKAEGRGMVPQARFLASVSLTPAARFRRLGKEVAAAHAALADLEAELSSRCGESAPSLTPLAQPLVAIQAFCDRVSAERGEDFAAPGAGAGDVLEEDGSMGEEGQEGDRQPAPEGRPGGRPGAISHRGEAFERLTEAADYLMRTEPHSPVPYLVRRAVSWGNLSLAELFEELLQKNTDLAAIYALLGIKRTG